MPARFRLNLERIGGAKTWPSAYIAAYCLRGAVIPYLKDAAGIDGVHGHRYSIHIPTPSTAEEATVKADLCLLSDNLVAQAYKALDAMRIEALPIVIGDVTARVDGVGVACAEPVFTGRSGSAAPLIPEIIDVTLLSVTTFAAGNRRTRAIPDPTLIIKSWGSSWNGIESCPEQCRPEVIEELGLYLEPIDGNLSWSTARFHRNGYPGAPTVHAPYTMCGFTGRLTLRLHRYCSSDAASWLPRLAWLAGYAGTGYHSQIGLGATRAVPRGRSAGPPRHWKPPSSADAT